MTRLNFDEDLLAQGPNRNNQEKVPKSTHTIDGLPDLGEETTVLGRLPGFHVMQNVWYRSGDFRESTRAIPVQGDSPKSSTFDRFLGQGRSEFPSQGSCFDFKLYRLRDSSRLRSREAWDPASETAARDNM